MRKDPIVEEVRAIRNALSREFHHDVGELIAHLQQRSRDAGRKTVTLRPKRVTKPAVRTRRQRPA